MDASNDLLLRIEQLEAENRRLRERETDSLQTLHTLIRKLPAAAAAVGRGCVVLRANAPFVRAGGYRTMQLDETTPALAGVALREVLPAELCSMVENTQASGEDLEREDVLWHGVPYTFSVYNIRRGELTILLLRNLAAADIRVEELTARLQEAADRNIRMTQQIAFLLGEEVSESAKSIGSVIRALRATTLTPNPGDETTKEEYEKH